MPFNSGLYRRISRNGQSCDVKCLQIITWHNQQPISV